MGFPADVRGVYGAPERVVGVGAGGKPLKRSATAFVFHNRIIFVGKPMPDGTKGTEVAVFSDINDPPAFDDAKNLNPSVKINHTMNAPKDTPLVFTNEERTLPYQPQGGGKKFPTPVFNFKYMIPFYTATAQDPPWTFTKTGRSGGVADWTSPVKPDPNNVDPDPNDPKPEEDGGIDSHLIMLAVVLMVATVAAVNM